MSGRVPGVTTTPTIHDVIGLSWPLAMNALLLQAILFVDTILVTPLCEASLAAMGLAASLASVVSGVLFAYSTGTQLIVAQAWRFAFYLSVLVAALYLLMIFSFQWLYPDLQAETRGYLLKFLPVMLLLPAIRSAKRPVEKSTGVKKITPVPCAAISRFRQDPTPD